jgi:hypothetical protein
MELFIYMYVYISSYEEDGSRGSVCVRSNENS